MKSLIFNTEDVLAWKEGSKKLHFVKMRKQPVIRGGVWYPHDKAVRAFYYASEKHFRERVAKNFSPFRPGEKVYIRETYCCQWNGSKYEILYRATLPILYRDFTWVWKPPLYMREIDSRFHAIIKSVRPEEIDGVWFWRIEIEED